MNLTAATPVEIDTRAAELGLEHQKTQRAIQVLVLSLHSTAGDRGTRVRGALKFNITTAHAEEKTREIAAGESYGAAAAKRLLAKLDEFRAQRDRLVLELDTIDAEFASRGGWTRAWLVTSSEGHVHSSQGCSTCNIHTTFELMYMWSGSDEAGIVEAAGERACTVCYPTAPVDVLARPTRMFSTDEVAAQEARKARADAKAVREAKRLEKALLPDGSALRVKAGGYTESFTTLHSARGWLTDAYWWGLDHPSFPESAVIEVAEAVAAKEGKSAFLVRAEAEVRAKKRK